MGAKDGLGADKHVPACESRDELMLRRRARRAVSSWIAHAQTYIVEGAYLPVPVIRFNLLGHTAGMAVFTGSDGYSRQARLRLNPDLLKRYPEEMIDETVPHEVAHIVTRWIWATSGSRTARNGKA